MQQFTAHFSPDNPRTSNYSLEDDLRRLEAFASGMTDLLSVYGGTSFRGGLYRLHAPQTIAHWTEIVTTTFPRYRNRIHCFGYDWLGRHFAIDQARIADGQAQILLLDPGFNEALEIPASFVTFHETELVDFAADALAEPFFHRWLAAGGASPGLDQCVGYRVLPVLGGKDEITNLEISDMDVYWTIAGQILAKI